MIPSSLKMPLCALSLISLGAVTACSPAGEVPNSTIGRAVQENQLTQIAYGDPSDRLRDLAIQFAAETRDTVNFAFDSSRLDSAAQSALNTQVAWLKAHPDIKMSIVGHTDLVGSERYNDGLGLRRARSVIRYLVRKGVKRARLVALESRGEAEPVVATEERERRNRRAVTTVSGFERGFVGDGLDGEVAQRLFNSYQAGAIQVEEANSSETGG